VVASKNFQAELGLKSLISKAACDYQKSQLGPGWQYSSAEALERSSAGHIRGLLS